MDSPVYRKGLAFKGMMCSSDGDAWRKILVMGSVWLLPSTISATNSCSGRYAGTPTASGCCCMWSGGSRPRCNWGMGPWWRGTKAVLRAGLVSPILSNLFLHYAFDRWMQRHFADIRFERFADDAICHCKTWAQAQRLRAALERRFAECHLELHPQKTRVVYCKDDDRRGAYLTTALTSWDIRFGPGAQRIGGESTSSISLLPSAIQLRRRCARRCEAGRCRIGVISR